jgi:hypothetical protein
VVEIHGIDISLLQHQIEPEIGCQHQNPAGTHRGHSGIGQSEAIEAIVGDQQAAAVVSFFNLFYDQLFE